MFSSFPEVSLLASRTLVSFFQHMLHTTARMFSLKRKSGPCYLLMTFSWLFPIFGTKPRLFRMVCNPMKTRPLPSPYPDIFSLSLSPRSCWSSRGSQALPDLKLPKRGSPHPAHCVPAHPSPLGSTASSSGKRPDTSWPTHASHPLRSPTTSTEFCVFLQPPDWTIGSWGAGVVANLYSTSIKHSSGT